MRDLLTKPWMSEREYRANVEGMNIFFGAVLGFVLAGTEVLSDGQFAKLLLLIASAVVTILYITASERRLVYAILAAAVIAVMPRIGEALIETAGGFPRKVQPTLAVWAALTIVVEFAPRERTAAPAVPTSPT